MINIANVAAVTPLLQMNTILTSEGVITVDAAMKASWQVMISSTFSLLFPDIHKLFPTRVEVQRWLLTELRAAFNDHHTQNDHLWKAQKMGPGQTNVMFTSFPELIPWEVILARRTRNTAMPISAAGALGDALPDVVLSPPTFQMVTAWAMSPFNMYLAK
jgi:hypothetical protein